MTNLRGRCTLLALSLAATAPQNTLAAISSRTVAFEYEATSGLLKKEIVEPDNAQLRVDTAYTYDSFGNKTAATVSSPATGMAAVAARSVSVGYDARGQFPVSGKNALSQSVTRIIEPKFGVPTSITDANALKGQWQYDTFGRRTLATYADGTKTQWVYSYCSGYNGGTAACPGLAIYLIQVLPQTAAGAANGPWTKVYMDGLDRPVRTETLGFDGTTSIYQDTSYDRLGRVSRTSRPYYSGQTAQWTTTTYDAVGRPQKIVAPDGTSTVIGYNGPSVSVTNALSQTRTQTRNTRGEVVTVTDAANKTTTYKYDPFGNLLTATDPVGNVITLGYDLLGRKTSMADPDLGKWSYSYDALGQLVKQTDTKSQVSTMSYDLLGRPLSRAEPDLISNWTYDSCTNGVGKLCKTTADNGYLRTATYDSFGREAGGSTTIDTVYAVSGTFDSNGRVATRTYPNGLVVKYVYTSLGYLKEVRNNATNALYWQANSQDAEGHVLQQTYGNGVVTQQVFEASTGRLKNIYAGAGNGVQNVTYGYDLLGQMLSRKDGNQNLTETFLYDTLNRLTSNTVNSSGGGVVTQSYGYDSIGNITSRSDMGNYTYGAGAGPHAVTQVALAGGGTRQYIYDVNGNLTQEVQRDAGNNIVASKGRTESYTSFNMPAQLASPSATLKFVYGPGHQRIKQIAPGATTIYVHPDNEGGLGYEKDIKADGTIEHKNFITAGGSVVALVKQAGTSTTITSTLYFHRDNLGSNTAMTNEAGVVVERFAYEPFGKRRAPTGVRDPNGAIAGVTTDRGFTNHEYLDELDLIHMNGRVYDPALGRFLSADPGVPYPMNIQSYNRYSYTQNNPLVMLDPTGLTDCIVSPGTYIQPSGEYQKCVEEEGRKRISDAQDAAKRLGGSITGGGPIVVPVPGSRPSNGGSDFELNFASAAAIQHTADKVAGAAFGGMVGTTAGLAVSGGCDIVSGGICIPANAGIVAVGATGGAVLGAAVGPPFMVSSRLLAKNILAFTSQLKLQGQHSHHIVAENDKRAALSVAILASNGMSVNSAFNGMNMNGSYHERIHTDTYHIAVTNALVGSSSYADVAVRLTAIKAQIYMGIFPF